MLPVRFCCERKLHQSHSSTFLYFVHFIVSLTEKSQIQITRKILSIGLVFPWWRAVLPLCFRLCCNAQCAGWRPGRYVLPPCWGAAPCALWLSHTSLHVSLLPHNYGQKFVSLSKRQSDCFSSSSSSQGHRTRNWCSFAWEPAHLWSVLLLHLRQAGINSMYWHRRL